MNEPMTWGDYFFYKTVAGVFVPLVGMIVFLVVGGLMMWLVPPECSTCGRRKQRAPRGSLVRWLCPFHDEVSAP